jgi:hypothetical protein
MALTLKKLTKKQKEFLQDSSVKAYDKNLDMKILSRDHRFVEYGDQYCIVVFEHAGVKYEAAYVFETGPATYDWDSQNAAAEDCYLELFVEPKKAITAKDVVNKFKHLGLDDKDLINIFEFSIGK